MTFKERLGELLNSLEIDDPRDKVDLRLYCKWRIQAKPGKLPKKKTPHSTS